MHPFLIDNLLRTLYETLGDEKKYLADPKSQERIMSVMAANFYPVVEELNRVEQFWHYHGKPYNIAAHYYEE